MKLKKHTFKSIQNIFFGTLLTMGSITVSPAAVLFQDSFSDNDFQNPEGANGLTWSVQSGVASVISGELALRRGGGLITSNQSGLGSEFTVLFDAKITWSNPGSFVFLYQNPNNFYKVGLGSKRGIYRVMDGTETLLVDDPGNRIRLPHGSASPGAFKLYVKNAEGKILIQVDRDGDGVDFDLSYEESDPTAVSRFQSGAIGLMDESAADGTPWVSLDHVFVHDVKVESNRVPVTFYVSASSGDDSRTVTEAQNSATPWKTIQKAADVAWSGDRVKVMPGIYRETVSPVYSGSQNNPITFEAFDPNNRPILDGSEQVSLGGWTTVNVTDFLGNVRSVSKTTIAWEPKAIYQEGERLFPAQHPNQPDPNDTYNKDYFLEVPAAENPDGSNTQLIDPTFLTQAGVDFWKGGVLSVHDGFSNTVNDSLITGFDPSQDKIMVGNHNRLIGNDAGKLDRYSIRKHLGVLDKEGEYYVDTSVTPHEIYVWGLSGKSLDSITASRAANAFLFNGNKEGYVVDGFEIQNYEDESIFLNRVDHVTIKNVEIHHGAFSGIVGRFINHIKILDSYIHTNENNGIALGDGKDFLIDRCEITANNNNGIWVGGGTPDVYNSYNLVIRNSYIHHQGGGFSHPDNLQFHQVKNILIEKNIFAQAHGHQNGWSQYTDNYIFRNNVVMGGPLGINSAIHSYVNHNVFYYSHMRYDAHITNNPHRGDYYKPVLADIRNNVIIESIMTLPALETGVNRSETFLVDHNYFNLTSHYFRRVWDIDGVGFGAHSLVDESSDTLSNIFMALPDENLRGQDFRLKPGVTLIDAATDLNIHNDLSGHRRPFGSSSDIGPYEFGSTETVPDDGSPFPGSPEEGDGEDGSDGEGTDGGADGSSSLPAVIVESFVNLIQPGGAQELSLVLSGQAGGQVKVEVYDRQGELVKVVFNEFVAAGERRTLNWDGKNADGVPVVSGIYALRFNIDGSIETKKLAILR